MESGISDRRRLANGRRIAPLALLAGMGGIAAPARAQIIEIPDLELPISNDLDRGRNQSVLDRPRPAWDPAGIRAGGFLIFPYAEARLGYTDNVYQSAITKRSDGYVRVNAGVAANSAWSRHNLSIAAATDLYRFFRTPERNENGWSVAGRGRIDISDRARIGLQAQTAQRYESRLSGAAIPDARTAAPFQQTTLRAVGDVRLNRVRAVAFANYTDLGFGRLTLASGTSVSQATRDREIVRVGGRIEYALTPDAGLFVEASHANLDYRRDIAPGIANRDSNEARVLGGVTVDITHLIRASAAVGYVDRGYVAPLYADIRGVTARARIEYFPTMLTTVTVSARREVEDSSAVNGGFFQTGGGLRVDHELLRNLILSAAGDYGKEDYIGSGSRATILRAGFAARYLASRTLELGADVNASERRVDGPGFTAPNLTELRATVSLRLRR